MAKKEKKTGLKKPPVKTVSKDLPEEISVNKGNRKAVLIVAVLSLVAVWPLFLPLLYRTHDFQHHLYRIAQFAVAFQDGQIPVRWLPDMMLGHGLPVFVFIPPLPYYLAQILSLFGLGVISSYKIVTALSVTLSGIAMFFFARELFSRNAAVAAAVAYMFAPYRFVDVYVRGAMSECLVFVFIPLVFLFTKRIVESEKRINLLLLAVSVAGIILTHNVTAVFVLPAALLYGAFLLIAAKNYMKILSFIFPYLAALGLSVFYWLPALIEKKYTLLDSVYGVKFFNFRDHFVFFQQLISPFWDYGGSEIGLDDGMSFQLGSLYLAVSVVGGILAFYVKNKALRIHNIFFLLVLVMSIFMMTWWSKPLWEVLPLISFVQFPWRFLTLVVFASSCLMGILIQATKSRPELTKQAGIIVLALLPALLLPSFFLDIKEGIFKTTYFVLYYAGLSMLFLVIWMLRGFSRKFFIAGLSALIVVTAMPLWNIPLQVSLSGKPEAAGLHDYAGDIFKPEMVRQKIVRAGATFEFVPSSVQKFVAGTFVDERNIVEVIEGKADISEIKRKSDYLSFSVKSSETARLLVRIFYFPGWTCYINGGKTSGTVDNQGRMLFSVAPGGYSIVLKFENTGIRTGSNIAAFITAVFLLGMALYLWVRQRRKGKE